MRIGIDFDEVIADSIEFIIRLHNERYGTHLTRADISTYNLEDVWGVSREEAIRRFDEFFATDQLVGISPIAGSIKGINELKKAGHDLYIVTGRSGNDVAETERWLKHHFPDTFKGVHYGNHFSLDKAQVFRRKGDICKELGIELLIDDNFKVSVECAEAGVKVFLFDQLWNRDKTLPPGILRVSSWDDIVKKIGS